MTSDPQFDAETDLPRRAQKITALVEPVVLTVGYVDGLVETSVGQPTGGRDNLAAQVTVGQEAVIGGVTGALVNIGFVSAVEEILHVAVDLGVHTHQVEAFVDLQVDLEGPRRRRAIDRLQRLAVACLEVWL